VETYLGARRALRVATPPRGRRSFALEFVMKSIAIVSLSSLLLVNVACGSHPQVESSGAQVQAGISLVGKRFEPTRANSSLRFVDDETVTLSGDFGSRDHAYTITGTTLRIDLEPGEDRYAIENGGRHLRDLGNHFAADYDCSNCDAVSLKGKRCEPV